MFEKFKRSVDGLVSAARDLAPGPPPDLSAMPELPVGVTSLDGIDVATITAYVGLPVRSVVPLGTPGAGPSLDAARLERLRAQGMSEEQLQAAVDHVAAAFANQWQVTFENGNQATVQLFTNGDDHGDFDRLEAQWKDEQTRLGMEAMHESLLLNRVHEIDGSPYPTYENGAEVVARGPVHEGLGKAKALGTAHHHEVLGGLLALALRAVDGPPGT